MISERWRKLLQFRLRTLLLLTAVVALLFGLYPARVRVMLDCPREHLSGAPVRLHVIVRNMSLWPHSTWSDPSRALSAWVARESEPFSEVSFLPYEAEVPATQDVKLLLFQSTSCAVDLHEEVPNRPYGQSPGMRRVGLPIFYHLGRYRVKFRYYHPSLIARDGRDARSGFVESEEVEITIRKPDGLDAVVWRKFGDILSVPIKKGDNERLHAIETTRQVFRLLQQNPGTGYKRALAKHIEEEASWLWPRAEGVPEEDKAMLRLVAEYLKE